MNVKDTVELGSGHFIEFGYSTWDPSQESVRNRYSTSTGGFNRFGSSEIPLDDIEGIVIETAKRDKLEKNEIVRIIKELLNSLERLH